MDSCLFSLWPRENCFLVIDEMLVTCFPCSCSSLERLTVAKHVIEGSTCSVGFLVKEYLNAQITQNALESNFSFGQLQECFYAKKILRLEGKGVEALFHNLLVLVWKQKSFRFLLWSWITPSLPDIQVLWFISQLFISMFNY